VKRFVASSAALVILDQVTKLLARRGLTGDEPVQLLGDVLRLRLVHNAGAAFGLFPGNRLVFILVSILSIALILYLIFSRRYLFRGSFIAFGAILGGAIGNLIDRLWLHRVVDFIDVGAGIHRWPTFNVADIGVTLGVLYLAGHFLVSEALPQRASEQNG